MNQEKIWDEISPQWQKYKTQSPEFIKKFLKNKIGKILDHGCGSGRNFTKTNGQIIAVDFSQKMLDQAKEKAEKLNIKLIKANAIKLPFKDNFFDAAISIATFHCIKEKSKREKAIRELYRVLKPKSQALISVWDKEARRFRNKSKNIKVPWTINNEKIYRDYYLYDYEEFKNILEKTGFKILKRIETRANIIVVVGK